MLNDKNEAVLTRILTECKGEYKIFETADFCEVDNVDKSIKYLNDNGYIILRYNRKNEYLIAPTQKGNFYFESKKQRLLRDAIFAQILGKKAFKGAFFGAFFAIFCLGVLLICITLAQRAFYAF